MCTKQPFGNYTVTKSKARKSGKKTQNADVQIAKYVSQYPCIMVSQKKLQPKVPI